MDSLSLYDISCFAAGFAGNLFAFALFLSPVPAFKRILKAKSTEQFDGLPYLLSLLNCFICLWYGLPWVSDGRLLVATVNGTGAVFQLAYIFLFFIYADSRRTKDKISLIWYSRKKEKFLRLSSVTKIIPGQRTAVFGRFLRPEKDYLSFSLIYKKSQRSLDLVCKDQAEVEVWFSTLEGLISSCRKNSSVDEHKGRASFSDEISYYQDSHSYDSTLDIASSISRSFNSAGYCGTNSLTFRRSDAGSDCVNMIRTSGADSSRLSFSSAAPSSCSQGSGTEDKESLGDVYGVKYGLMWP